MQHWAFRRHAAEGGMLGKNGSQYWGCGTFLFSGNYAVML
jgi:hypothetical protein